MTTSTFSAAPHNHVNTWMKTLHDAFVALGLVVTSDTGQLSMASAPTWVSTASTNYGYTVYRFNDALQATYPLFLKVSWLNSADTAGDSHRLDVTVGTGTDGAGTVTGPTIGPVTITQSTATSQSATTYPSYLCLVAGSFVADLFAGDTAGELFFAVDRMRDADGTANVHGAALTTFARTSAGATIVSQRHFSVVNGSAASGQTIVSCFVPYAYFNSVSSLSLADDIPVFGHTFLTPHANHLLGVVTVPQGDVAADTVFTVVRLGASHTYRATGTRTTQAGAALSDLTVATATTQSSALALAYLYE